ncbi:hypothetical protein LINPERPRIM_LOCUS30088 [Linum perenne]
MTRRRGGGDAVDAAVAVRSGETNMAVRQRPTRRRQSASVVTAMTKGRQQERYINGEKR